MNILGMELREELSETKPVDNRLILRMCHYCGLRYIHKLEYRGHIYYRSWLYLHHHTEPVTPYDDDGWYQSFKENERYQKEHRQLSTLVDGDRITLGDFQDLVVHMTSE